MASEQILEYFFKGALYAELYVFEQAVDIPHKVTAAFFSAVGKAENFVRYNLSVLFPADYVPARRRAYIYCKVIIFHNIFLLPPQTAAATVVHFIAPEEACLL